MSLSQQKPNERAQATFEKQATLDSLTNILKTELDVSFVKVMYHARVAFHICDDVMLRRYFDKVIKCLKVGPDMPSVIPLTGTSSVIPCWIKCTTKFERTLPLYLLQITTRGWQRIGTPTFSFIL